MSTKSSVWDKILKSDNRCSLRTYWCPERPCHDSVAGFLHF